MGAAPHVLCGSRPADDPRGSFGMSESDGLIHRPGTCELCDMAIALRGGTVLTNEAGEGVGVAWPNE